MLSVKCEAVNKLSNEIRPIDEESVHKICSGQVIYSLAMAVKELIENAIDASASFIDIRLFNYGSYLINVSDDGCGIERGNFESLTKKYYTSKIQSFDDLQSLSTFGFRGEALSSLCALCDLSVFTRHKLDELGSKITYDRSGRIVSIERRARNIGTIVELRDLFKYLPVRHSEFNRNINREFTKLCQIVQAYALILQGTKIIFSNEKNNKINSIINTTGRCIKDNIISVFGIKQFKSLLEINDIEIDADIFSELNLDVIDKDKLPIKLSGFISSSQPECGRQTTDRQFIYVNGRPIDYPKITKLINKIYSQYTAYKKPFICLNIQIPPKNVDVNVTPEKRVVMFHNEKLILAVLKSTVLKTLQKQQGVFTTDHSLSLTPKRKIKNVFSDGVNSDNFKKSKLVRSLESEDDVIDESLENGSVICHSQSEMWRNFINKSRRIEPIVPVNLSDDDSNDDEPKALSKTATNCRIKCIDLIKTKKVETPKTKTSFHTVEVPSLIDNDSPTKFSVFIEELNTSDNDELTVKEDMKKNSKCEFNAINIAKNRNRIEIEISLDQIKNIIEQKRLNLVNLKENKILKFRSKLLKNDNDDAVKEFEREITKESFYQMRIIGQFNLGFIITKLENDLFIVDQHASDEKYNYETLRNTTNITTQPLIVPQKLHLTPDKVGILIDNIKIFQKLGFIFEIKSSDENDNQQVYLKAIPVSKNINFDKDDIEEMLFSLQESSITECEPSKLHSMFASRACRKSVMIGKALKVSEMRKIINHMGDTNQPWNCPHGRPTLRHLINLKLINT